MKQLSIIIVNFNVQYFLEQCLRSVSKAINGIDAEVIVIDNNSSDGSAEMVKQAFPWVSLIVNKENTGFAKANNQGIQQAKGKYILLLNPDTVVQGNTFSACIEFMDNHPNAGALGVKMIDGTGRFLPESKRSFPGPLVAFYKLFGLASLFPKSKRFGKYHLTYLPQNQTNEVDVLSGAFMFMRKSVLDTIEGLDETFFMYGEDIDLSYQIQEAGFKNYYFPETTIIHYKGESTKKGSLNYVKHFYQAMIIFAKKHFSGGKASLFVLLMQLAIGFRAALTLLSNAIRPVGLALIDAILGFFTLWTVKELWQYLNPKIVNYPAEILYTNFPIYLFVWLMALFLRGAYDKPYRAHKLLSGIIWGSVFVGLVYAFLPDSLRFSRVFIVLSAVGLFGVFYSSRWLSNLFFTGEGSLNYSPPKRLLVVSEKETGTAILNKLNALNIPFELLGWVSSKQQASESYLSGFSQLKDVVAALNPTEVIVNEQEVSYASIIALMAELANEKLTVKIASENGERIIGSTSKNTSGDIYTEEMHLNINEEGVKRRKRLNDLLLSVALLLTLPLTIWFFKQKSQYIQNLFALLVGKRTLVGYTSSVNEKLPAMKAGIIHPLSGVPEELKTAQLAARFNTNYAKNYSQNTDWQFILKHWRRLDSKPQKLLHTPAHTEVK